MVLLTSSSISFAISSGIVFLFTFLLFLSGYVVQQQAVRSVRAALHSPPIPTSNLPVYFQHVYDNAEKENVNAAESAGRIEAQKEGEDHLEVINAASSAEDATSQIITSDKDNASPREPSIAIIPPALEPSARLAYVQLLSKPSQICSALLLFKLQMDYGDADISRVIVYPSLWEEDTSSDAFTSAVGLMRLVKEQYNITYHPIRIDNFSEERDIGRELVAHLAIDDWQYDRMMYLRSPGLVLNVGALDSALQASKSQALLSRNWAPSDSATFMAPTMLLVSDHVTYTPRGSNRRLIAEAFTSHANHHEGEMDVEAAAENAAYIHFEEGELEHRREAKEWYGGVFERYERGSAEICEGTNFEGRTELKRVRKRGWR